MTGKLTLGAMVLAGLALGGCATSQSAQSTGSGPSTAVASSSAPTADGSPESKAEANSVKAENLIADCMKAKGFTYVPRPLKSTGPASGDLAEDDPALVPYDQLKAYRAKYGYGIFAADVYPHDPNVGGSAEPDTPNPNDAIRNALSPPQRDAYDMALLGEIRGAAATDKAGKPDPNSCTVKASEAVYGPGTTSDGGAQAVQSQAVQAFQADPQVLQAAQGYASCLVGRGYQVTSPKPGSIERTVRQEAQALHDQGGQSPQQGLTKEVKMSLDDLDCGKNYEAKAKPFVQQILASGGAG